MVKTVPECPKGSVGAVDDDVYLQSHEPMPDFGAPLVSLAMRVTVYLRYHSMGVPTSLRVVTFLFTTFFYVSMAATLFTAPSLSWMARLSSLPRLLQLSSQSSFGGKIYLVAGGVWLSVLVATLVDLMASRRFSSSLKVNSFFYHSAVTAVMRFFLGPLVLPCIVVYQQLQLTSSASTEASSPVTVTLYLFFSLGLPSFVFIAATSVCYALMNFPMGSRLDRMSMLPSMSPAVDIALKVTVTTLVGWLIEDEQRGQYARIPYIVAGVASIIAAAGFIGYPLHVHVGMATVHVTSHLFVGTAAILTATGHENWWIMLAIVPIAGAGLIHIRYVAQLYKFKLALFPTAYSKESERAAVALRPTLTRSVFHFALAYSLSKNLSLDAFSESRDRLNALHMMPVVEHNAAFAMSRISRVADILERLTGTRAYCRAMVVMSTLCIRSNPEAAIYEADRAIKRHGKVSNILFVMAVAGMRHDAEAQRQAVSTGFDSALLKQFHAKQRLVRHQTQEVKVAMEAFWSQLSLHDPNLQLLFDYSADLYKRAKDAEMTHLWLLDHFPEREGLIRAYADFTRDVVQDVRSADKLRRFADLVHAETHQADAGVGPELAREEFLAEFNFAGHLRARRAIHRRGVPSASSRGYSVLMAMFATTLCCLIVFIMSMTTIQLALADTFTLASQVNAALAEVQLLAAATDLVDRTTPIPDPRIWDPRDSLTTSIDILVDTLTAFLHASDNPWLALVRGEVADLHKPMIVATLPGPPIGFNLTADSWGDPVYKVASVTDHISRVVRAGLAVRDGRHTAGDMMVLSDTGAAGRLSTTIKMIESLKSDVHQVTFVTTVLIVVMGLFLGLGGLALSMHLSIARLHTIQREHMALFLQLRKDTVHDVLHRVADMPDGETPPRTPRARRSIRRRLQTSTSRRDPILDESSESSVSEDLMGSDSSTESIEIDLTLTPDHRLGPAVDFAGLSEATDRTVTVDPPGMSPPSSDDADDFQLTHVPYAAGLGISVTSPLAVCVRPPSSSMCSPEVHTGSLHVSQSAVQGSGIWGGVGRVAESHHLSPSTPNPHPTLDAGGRVPSPQVSQTISFPIASPGPSDVDPTDPTTARQVDQLWGLAKAYIVGVDQANTMTVVTLLGLFIAFVSGCWLLSLLLFPPIYVAEFEHTMAMRHAGLAKTAATNDALVAREDAALMYVQHGRPSTAKAYLDAQADLVELLDELTAMVLHVDSTAIAQMASLRQAAEEMLLMEGIALRLTGLSLESSGHTIPSFISAITYDIASEPDAALNDARYADTRSKDDDWLYYTNTTHDSTLPAAVTATLARAVLVDGQYLTAGRAATAGLASMRALFTDRPVGNMEGVRGLVGLITGVSVWTSGVSVAGSVFLCICRLLHLSLDRLNSDMRIVHRAETMGDTGTATLPSTAQGTAGYDSSESTSIRPAPPCIPDPTAPPHTTRGAVMRCVVAGLGAAICCIVIIVTGIVYHRHLAIRHVSDYATLTARTDLIIFHDAIDAALTHVQRFAQTPTPRLAVDAGDAIDKVRQGVAQPINIVRRAAETHGADPSLAVQALVDVSQRVDNAIEALEIAFQISQWVVGLGLTNITYQHKVPTIDVAEALPDTPLDELGFTAIGGKTSIDFYNYNSTYDFGLTSGEKALKAQLLAFSPSLIADVNAVQSAIITSTRLMTDAVSTSSRYSSFGNACLVVPPMVASVVIVVIIVAVLIGAIREHTPRLTSRSVDVTHECDEFTNYELQGLLGRCISSLLSINAALVAVCIIVAISSFNLSSVDVIEAAEQARAAAYRAGRWVIVQATDARLADRARRAADTGVVDVISYSHLVTSESHLLTRALGHWIVPGDACPACDPTSALGLGSRSDLIQLLSDSVATVLSTSAPTATRTTAFITVMRTVPAISISFSRVTAEEWGVMRFKEAVVRAAVGATTAGLVLWLAVIHIVFFKQISLRLAAHERMVVTLLTMAPEDGGGAGGLVTWFLRHQEQLTS